MFLIAVTSYPKGVNYDLALAILRIIEIFAT